MRVKRITISVPEHTAARLKKASAGASVSAWVADAIEARLQDAELERLWQSYYESVSPRVADIRRAEAMFNRISRTRKKSVA